MMNMSKAYRLARAEVLRDFPELVNATSEEDLARLDGYITETLADWKLEAACERDERGIPEDSPSIQSADLFGTGEGRYHGVI